TGRALRPASGRRHHRGEPSSGDDDGRVREVRRQEGKRAPAARAPPERRAVPALAVGIPKRLRQAKRRRARLSPPPFFCFATTRTSGVMLEDDIAQLEERVQRLIAALEQARLEKRSLARERDRLIAINAELRKRIEGVVERVKTLESENEA